ncbi:GTP-binding protein [Haloimpatiens sp. FM7330]|uniref:GTP-binding protein n=1 Tax=Haloimpatiens sp. FM7330 TaxID=3298610 RepID=UPI00363D5283
MMELSQNRKIINVGLVAHVDAGKTTTTEQIMYLAGNIRKIGSVDKGSSHMDYCEIEKKRGITVFSEQTTLKWKDTEINLIDTPGHTDFSSELKRSLNALDAAVLIISAVEGVQAHTETIWNLLRENKIPTLIFINKLDRVGADLDRIYSEIEQNLTRDFLCLHKAYKLEKDFDGIVDLLEDTYYRWNSYDVFDFEKINKSEDEDKIKLIEKLADKDDYILEKYLNGDDITKNELVEHIKSNIESCDLYPVLLGSSIRGIGINNLLDGLCNMLPKAKENLDGDFSAFIYKVKIDESIGKLSYVRVINGTIKVRDTLYVEDEDGQAAEEKVTQIRKYSGEKYTVVEKLQAGEIGVLCGVKNGKIGDIIGTEKSGTGYECLGTGHKSCQNGQAVFNHVIEEKTQISSQNGQVSSIQKQTVQNQTVGTGNEFYNFHKNRQASLTSASVLISKVTAKNEEELSQLLNAVKILNVEDPELNFTWNKDKNEININVMGFVQMEVLKQIIKDRFNIEVELEKPRVNYLETINKVSRGFCHFEPKKHYAEVEVEIEPNERGKGVEFVSNLSVDILPLQYQNNIEKAVFEAVKHGTLIGSSVTDIKIKLIDGKYHLEHTHGGDFRIAAIRAVQKALSDNENILLEPLYSYKITVDKEFSGKVMSDILKMNGTFEDPIANCDKITIKGEVPISTSMYYPIEIASATSGKAVVNMNFSRFSLCHNEDEVLANTKNVIDKDETLYNGVSLFREKRKMKKVK